MSMPKFNIKKILSLVFFLIISLLLYLAVVKTNTYENDSVLFIIYAGIFLSASFLLGINLSGKNYSSEEGSLFSDNKTDKKRKAKENENTELKTREYINGILFDIHKVETIKELGELLLKNFAKTFQIVQGIIYVLNPSSKKFVLASSYAFFSENKLEDFEPGEGIAGQVANDQNIKLIKDIADDYIKVLSGLGSSSAKNLLIIPIVHNNKTIAMIELAAFDDFPQNHQKIYKSINKTIADKFNSLIQ